MTEPLIDEPVSTAHHNPNSPYTAEDQRRKRHGHQCDGLHPGRVTGSRLAISLSVVQVLGCFDSSSIFPGTSANQGLTFFSSWPRCRFPSEVLWSHVFFFQKMYGPFPDYASLSAFHNRKLDIAKGASYPDGDGNTIYSARHDAEPFDDSKPLVFIHGDLSMRNIIFGRDGRIWLVDWSVSGFYPPWFEYVLMVYAAENDVAPDSWNHLIPFVADPLFKHMRWIGQLTVAFIAYC
jgi:hypothetical protein